MGCIKGNRGEWKNPALRAGLDEMDGRSADGQIAPFADGHTRLGTDRRKTQTK